jgi:hypothetical protein
MGYFAETMANFDAVQSLVEVKGEAELDRKASQSADYGTHNHDIGKWSGDISHRYKTDDYRKYENNPIAGRKPMKTRNDYYERRGKAATSNEIIDKQLGKHDKTRAALKSSVRESISMFDSVPL